MYIARMSNYPPGFGIQDQARYFGRSRDSYAERQREIERAEAFADYCHYSCGRDKEEPEVAAWRNKEAARLRALRAKKGRA